MSYYFPSSIISEASDPLLMSSIGLSFENQRLKNLELFDFDRILRAPGNVFLPELLPGPRPDRGLLVGHHHVADLLPGVPTLGQETSF